MSGRHDLQQPTHPPSIARARINLLQHHTPQLQSEARTKDNRRTPTDSELPHDQLIRQNQAPLVLVDLASARKTESARAVVGLVSWQAATLTRLRRRRNSRWPYMAHSATHSATLSMTDMPPPNKPLLSFHPVPVSAPAPVPTLVLLLLFCTCLAPVLSCSFLACSWFAPVLLLSCSCLAPVLPLSYHYPTTPASSHLHRPITASRIPQVPSVLPARPASRCGLMLQIAPARVLLDVLAYADALSKKKEEKRACTPKNTASHLHTLATPAREPPLFPTSSPAASLDKS
ncbi:hypothetical protein K504DRAFT_463501 [Pleomassaria siparia CBS 279.74]|uniref:Uncharacterized protein n=1 Tax=Pleomassaria siparia CBS 279.74 TaxID=1314801 RepID=A0A6G1JTD9_9PLEO|nr:hypothetical protein K504DRAFT_463501 [Pleomassaria siparia CBS 279.74]